jgi:hypothetical protein
MSKVPPSQEQIQASFRRGFISSILSGGMAGVLCCAFMNGWLFSSPQLGVVNRESLIQKKAQEIAQTSPQIENEEALTTTLQRFKALYDKAIVLLAKKRNIILLSQDAVISSQVPDYTPEVVALMEELSLREEGKAQGGKR